MHAAMTQTPKGPFFYWNVDGAVGKNGQNEDLDVLFVTWCLYKLARWPQVSPALKARLLEVGLTNSCSGRDGDRVVEGIKALQQEYQMPVDGRVSSVPRGSAQYSGRGGKSTYLIFYPLNAVVAQMHPQQWPRIDLMPEFAWRLKEKATAPFAW